jgi:hypothetical protein
LLNRSASVGWQRDVRHFAAVRLRDGRGFELVVHPIDPEKS